MLEVILIGTVLRFYQQSELLEFFKVQWTTAAFIIGVCCAVITIVPLVIKKIRGRSSKVDLGAPYGTYEGKTHL